MTDALVIVDMHAPFIRSIDSPLVERVRKVLQQFIKEKKEIILLEFEGRGMGATTGRLTELLCEYEKCHTVYKHLDDGSKEVHRTLYDNTLSLTVCGVNYPHCVRSTAVGLAHYGYSVRVPRDLSNPENCWPAHVELADQDFLQNGIATCV
jgi:nicotinamidase-related amidase